jgi:hypothetical protein
MPLRLLDGKSRVFRARASFSIEARCQLFIRVYNEALTVAAMCANDKDRSSFAVGFTTSRPESDRAISVCLLALKS